MGGLSSNLPVGAREGWGGSGGRGDDVFIFSRDFRGSLCSSTGSLEAGTVGLGVLASWDLGVRGLWGSGLGGLEVAGLWGCGVWGALGVAGLWDCGVWGLWGLAVAGLGGQGEFWGREVRGGLGVAELWGCGVQGAGALEVAGLWHLGCLGVAGLWDCRVWGLWGLGVAGLGVVGSEGGRAGGVWGFWGGGSGGFGVLRGGAEGLRRCGLPRAAAAEPLQQVAAQPGFCRSGAGARGAVCGAAAEPPEPAEPREGLPRARGTGRGWETAA